MSLFIPNVAGSIDPFFLAVRDFLSEYSGWRWYLPWNRGRHHLYEMDFLVERIRTGRVTISGVIATLSGGVFAQNENMQRYRATVRAGLVRYLTQQNGDGWNALMIAVDRSDFESVNALLDAMTVLSQEERYAILSQGTVFDDWSVLALAARYSHTNMVSLLLQTMSDLSQKQRYNILSKAISPNHLDPLRLALYQNREGVVRLLLQALNDLNQEQRYRILRGASGGIDGALMMTVICYPEAIDLLIDAMKSLSLNQRYALLREASSAKLWQIVMNECPEVIDVLIVLIKEFSKKQRYTLLQSDFLGCENALMIAAQDQPEVLGLFLDVMGDLRQKYRYALLSQTSYEGENGLMIAAKNCPKAVTLLLEAIGGLSQKRQQIILSETTKYCGSNALMLAIPKCPTSAVLLIDVIRGLESFDGKMMILNQADERGYTPLALAQMAGEESTVALSILEIMDDLGILLSTEDVEPPVSQSLALNARFFYTPPKVESHLIKKLQQITGLESWRLQENPLTISIQSDDREHLEKIDRLLRYSRVMDVELKFNRKINQHTLTCSDIDIDGLLAIQFIYEPSNDGFEETSAFSNEENVLLFP